MPTVLTFEHPLNERTRTFLRLEHLFERFDHFAPQPEDWATRAALESLIEIVAITARADVRNELLKELERTLETLRRIASRPGVDPGALERVLSDLERSRNAILAIDGPIGQIAREDDFLKGVAQRNSIPGGSCSFDLPQLHHWLLQPPEQRQQRLADWLEDLRPAHQAIALTLSLVRASAPPRQAMAEAGFYQEALETQVPPQLVRIGVDANSGLYPEVSGHKNRFSIRFMTIESEERPAQTSDDIPFRLTCCLF
ncbi:cell division protein ZapD [Marichromatium gracile]|uniref:Cell division protein ZapD n=1 Tax=Marichromatium gracile TaxID=1048 RepID=A0A4R4AG57_MARGR|nr:MULTISPECIES: cell division protein ZapD [Marichromatium]MBO8084426.1 cell division protein ZapD [Marichromatium sp.]MBK1709274.1 cell division protein ZapD [Marichromatium gracile]MCF1182849.1 cell division protein ZapD [Marichromatium gracile]RNE94392.1 cell division protein ZapD [Marichromatium sp. AB32]TCW38218.1 cell division protein ZapD [Marichromatium gracile]